MNVFCRAGPSESAYSVTEVLFCCSPGYARSQGELYPNKYCGGVSYEDKNDYSGSANACDMYTETSIGTDPFNVDSDGDGLVDGEDGLIMLNLYPGGIDSNGDGFVDGEQTYGTEPTLMDSDGDQLRDGLEVASGTSPLDPNDWPNIADGDLAPYGDPDGIINAADVLIAARIIIGNASPLALQYAHGDMNEDGAIDLSDLIAITGIVLH